MGGFETTQKIIACFKFPDIIRVMQNTILAIVAHPDDEIIGLGGTLAKHHKQGDQIKVVIVGGRTSSRKNNHNVEISETKNALEVLGIQDFVNENIPDNRFDEKPLLEIIQLVSRHVEQFQPSLVYTHHQGDLNIDHKILSQAVVTACRPIENDCVKEIRLFETLSSTDMSGFSPTTLFCPNLFIDISVELAQKLSAMSYYVSELHEFPHPRSLKTIEYNAHLWGSKNNIPAAEAFHVLRKIQYSA